MAEILLTDEQLLEWLQVCRSLQSLKELTRQGSAASGLSRGDAGSVAAHTSLVGMMALILANMLKAQDGYEDIDPGRVAAMALLHDLSSAILGDINSEVKRYYFPEYPRGERLAFQDLLSGLQSAERLLALYDESVALQTTNARIVKVADGIDAWMEVIPRASTAWMQQHIDYRYRNFEHLKRDPHYSDELATTFLRVCEVLERQELGPKRPGSSSQDGDLGRVYADLHGLVLSSQQLVEWLQVCQTIQRLKRLTRQGFIASGGFNRWDTDSIADHTALVSLISLTLALELQAQSEMDIDPNHVAALALVHDVGESVLGDVNSETKQRYFENYAQCERRAIEDLLGQLLCAEHLLALYDEFELCETTAAKIVRFADSMDAWQRVTARASETWMPQHIEYRNRTFRKLKGDARYRDALAELFLRACLVIQGQPVGPKRSV